MFTGFQKVIFSGTFTLVISPLSAVPQLQENSVSITTQLKQLPHTSDHSSNIFFTINHF